MRRFPKIVVDVTLGNTCQCSRCPTVLGPFSPLYVLALSAKKSNVGKPICESCMKKEIEQRARVLRDDHAMKKVG